MFEDNRQRWRWMFVVCLTLPLAMPSWTVMAAETSGGDQGGLDEIIVTAQKKEENLQRIPVAVTALSADQMQQANIETALDFTYLTVGLQANQSPIDNTNIAFKIRGITSSNDFGEGDVALYIDGVYRQLQFGTATQLFDIDRVEVLKGAQGTLYGKNTEAGVVNIISRKPDLNETGGYATLDAGSYLGGGSGDRPAEKFQGAFNTPIIPGILAFRVAASFDQDDGYGKNAVGRNLDNESSPAVRASLLFSPNSDWKILLSADYSNFHSNNQAYRIAEAEPGALSTAVGLSAGYIKLADALPVLLGSGPPGPSFIPGTAEALALMKTSSPPGANFYDSFSGDGLARIELKGAAVTVDGNLGNDFGIKSITAYRSLNRASLADLDGTPFRDFETTTRDISSFYSEELNLFAKAGPVDLVGGAFYEYFDDHSGGVPGIGDQVLTPLLGYVTLYDAFEVTNSIGFFGHGVYHVTDKLDISGGVRWSQDKDAIQPRDKEISPLDNSTIIGCLDTDYGGTLTNGCDGPQLNLKSSGVSYDFSLNYQFSDDLMAYAKTSRGYKSGNFNVNGAYTSYQPEHVNDYEVGVKSEWLNHRFLANLAVYHIKYANIQRTVVVTEPDGSTGDETSNAASAHINGLELETLWKPSDHSEIGANYAYTDPRYDSYFSGSQNLSGSAWEVSKHTIDAHAQAGYSLNEANRFTARLDWIWQSDIVFAAYTNLFYDEPVLRQNSYGIVNGRLTYDLPLSNASIALYCRNMLGKKYYVAATGAESIGVSFITPGAPRFLGIQANYKFGGG